MQVVVSMTGAPSDCAKSILGAVVGEMLSEGQRLQRAAHESRARQVPAVDGMPLLVERLGRG
jgi:hypothetical protein